jgi:hypothetical protein
MNRSSQVLLIKHQTCSLDHKILSALAPNLVGSVTDLALPAPSGPEMDWRRTKSHILPMDSYIQHNTRKHGMALPRRSTACMNQIWPQFSADDHGGSTFWLNMLADPQLVNICPPSESEFSFFLYFAFLSDRFCSCHELQLLQAYDDRPGHCLHDNPDRIRWSTSMGKKIDQAHWMGRFPHDCCLGKLIQE